MQRPYSNERRNVVPQSRSHTHGHQLTPIPGSDASGSPSPSIHESITLTPAIGNDHRHPSSKGKNTPSGTSNPESPRNPDSVSRAQGKSSYVAHRPRPTQSLNAALEILTTSNSDSGHDSLHKSPKSATSDASVTSGSNSAYDHERLIQSSKNNLSSSPRQPIPAPDSRNYGSRRGNPVPTVAGKEISRPIPNHGEYLNMRISGGAYAATVQ